MRFTKLKRAVFVTLAVIALLGNSRISAGTPAPNAQEPVKGPNVTEVNFGSNGTVTGIFRQVGDKSWNRLNPNGSVVSSFRETGRDEWSVYLTDTSGTSTVHINLWLKDVTFRSGSTATVLGKVLSATNAAVSAEVQTRSAANNASQEGMIDWGAPPLSDAHMNEVMKWIAVKASVVRLPFCWKQSYGRGVGEPYICRDGFDRNGLLCYPKCKAGFVGNGPVCWGSCPAGLTDIGAFCQKPQAYGRGAGYPWKIGDKPFSLAGATSRCEAQNGKGGCEQDGAIIYPKCKAGFHKVGCCVCSPDCPAGWADTGTGCTKPSYGRGAGEPLEMGVCAPGLEKDKTGALCYPPCKNDYGGVGPVCWQNCPSQQSWDCGAGCATSQKECATSVFSMVSAPIIAALNIISLGQASAATNAAKAGASVATGGAAAASQAAKLSKLTQLSNSIKATMTAAKGSVTTLVGGAQNLAKIQNVVKVGGKVYSATSTIGEQVNLFSKEFADNFDLMTSYEIAREIDMRFGKEAAYQIKRQWGIRHLSMMLEANGFATAKNVISLVSIADPTGLVSVGNAFAHPVCKDNTPFPKVTPLYNR